jgi:hypothetical protein
MRRLVAAVCIALAAASANAADLKPHIITYTPALRGVPATVKLTGESTVSNTLRCKSWVIKHSSALALGPPGKPVLAFVRILQGEESRDGQTIGYSAQTSIHGNRASIKASGSTAGKGRGGSVDVQAGNSRRTVAIPEGTYLPMAAWEKVVDELSAGRKNFTLQEYDVSLAHGVVAVNYEVVNFAFGNAPLPPDPDGLLAGPSWIVKSAMVINGQTVEQIFQIHRSGAISRTLQTVKDVTVEFTAATVRTAPEAGC